MHRRARPVRRRKNTWSRDKDVKPKSSDAGPVRFEAALKAARGQHPNANQLQIKMCVSDWTTEKFGVRTRTITAVDDTA
jgi:hypothetical protein